MANNAWTLYPKDLQTDRKAEDFVTRFGPSILTMPTIEFNRWLKNHPDHLDDKQELKAARRRIKNRFYARDSRAKAKTKAKTYSAVAS